MGRREQIWGRPRPVLLTLAGKEDASRHYAVLCRSCRARGPVRESPAEANESWREREALK